MIEMFNLLTNIIIPGIWWKQKASCNREKKVSHHPHTVRTAAEFPTLQLLPGSTFKRTFVDEVQKV
jgi:hypothetical protein